MFDRGLLQAKFCCKVPPKSSILALLMDQQKLVRLSSPPYFPGLTAGTFAKDLPALLDELQIPVIYARECLKKYLIQELRHSVTAMMCI